MRCHHALALVALLALALNGCDSGEPPESDEPEPTPPAATPQAPAEPGLAEATEAVWAQGEQWLAEADDVCQAQHRAIEALLEAPDNKTLTEAREAWHQCHNAWHRLEPLLSLSDSNPGLFGALAKRGFDIHAHPIQPGYLDSIEGYPYSGIVNDISLSLSASELRRQHGLTDHSDVALGLHALEFLLWGQAGERPVADFTHQESAEDPKRAEELTEDQLPRNRRRTLLRLTSQLLQDDLGALHTDWTNPRSALAAPYHRLPAASRIPLLRDALRELLARRLPAYLAADEEATAHTPYAGEPRAAVRNALEAVQTLLEREPLANSLIPLEERDRWQNQWQQLLEKLGEAESPALIEALQSQAERLRPVGTPEAQGGAPAPASD